MPRVAKGHVEQLPSGSWRARVYAGIDPITKREIRLKATAKTEQQAHIELGRLLKEASEGRTPESEQLAVDSDHIMFASDYPYEMATDAARWIETTPISENDRRKICYGNAAALFGLPK